MDEQQRRLAECFCAVFPELSSEEALHASSATVPSWDSVAVVTLLTVIEEEFGISIEEDDPAKFDSFERTLSYLREAERKSEAPKELS
jgi:acyl carrier protein